MAIVITMQEMVPTMEINFAAGLPILFEGASGIGKTEGTEAYAIKMNQKFKDDGGYGYFELNCALASLPDVIGFMITKKEIWNAGGKDIEITSADFAYPYFARDKFTGKPAFMYDRGCIVLEEYGQGQGDVKRATAPITWEKRVGQFLFPKGCDVAILSNRPEDRSGVSKDFDFLINRRVQLQVKATLEGWLVWAHANGISNMSMAFAARNEDKVFANKAPEKQGPWLTPRSLVSGDKMLQAAISQGYSLDNDLVRKNLSGIMGEGNAHVFIAFAKIKDKLPTINQIINSPESTLVPSETDQQMFLVFDLAAKVKRENIKPIVKYIKRLPKDFSIAFYKNAVQRDPTLRSTTDFGDWAVENQTLLAAVHKG